jgi:hypothetical protein
VIAGIDHPLTTCYDHPMPRPPDVTQERIDAWLAKLGDQPERVLQKPPKVAEASKEAACAGYWLDEKLMA